MLKNKLLFSVSSLVSIPIFATSMVSCATTEKDKEKNQYENYKIEFNNLGDKEIVKSNETFTFLSNSSVSSNETKLKDFYLIKDEKDIDNLKQTLFYYVINYEKNHNVKEIEHMNNLLNYQKVAFYLSKINLKENFYVLNNFVHTKSLDTLFKSLFKSNDYNYNDLNSKQKDFSLYSIIQKENNALNFYSTNLELNAKLKENNESEPTDETANYVEPSFSYIAFEVPRKLFNPEQMQTLKINNTFLRYNEFVKFLSKNTKQKIN
ncbi:hypothetical protein [Mycoplasma sp. 5370]